MSKIVLLLEYDGTRYHGFQFQANASTIQAELERALYCITGQVIRVIAASRTDAGVHARGQVVSFRTDLGYPPQVWQRAINFHLPRDISVRRACQVEDEFHVQKQAVSREYSYAIWNGPYPSPLRAHFSYYVPHPLDVEAMNRACSYLLGEHDFSSFSPLPHPRPVRNVFKAEVRGEEGMACFRVEASSFLPHQVRHTVGALVQVGRGKRKPEGLAELLRAKTPGLAGPAVSPHGLCLLRVSYPRPLEEV
jgi:tRNA pseudouridine38-40 synthase